MDFTSRLYERMNFYRTAYEDTSKQAKEIQEEISSNEIMLDIEINNILEEIINDVITPSYKDSLERDFNINLDDFDDKYIKLKERLLLDIKKLKEDSRYKEYLEFLIDDDVQMVIDLENDEVFNYLIDENFHNDKFINKPYIKILFFIYQPRLWKFSKYANKKAKEFGLSDYKEMFKLWSDLRVSYKSLVGNKRIQQVIAESKQMEHKIKADELEIENIPITYRKDIILRLKDTIKNLNHFNDIRFSNIVPLKERYFKLRDKSESITDRMDSIMENITNVEKLITMSESENVRFNEKEFETFFSNSDPTVPVFELIPKNEWDDIKKAFEAKNIKLKSREDYSVVETKISQQKKEDLLNKYGVKEGEIFIDESLVGKEY